MELCSLQSLLRTVKKDGQEAWIVLLKERSGVAEPENPYLASMSVVGQHGADSEGVEQV